MPQLCRFWLQGHCKFGASCRFEHTAGGPGSKNQNYTNQNGSSINNTTYVFDKDTIISDLTTERPQWILSAYGPGKQAPAQLFGGYPREQSFEEIRLLYYMASSNPQQFEQTMLTTQKLIADSENQIIHTIQNIDAAINYLTEAGKQYPNRIDICRESVLGHGSATPIFNTKPSPFQTALSQNQTSSYSGQQLPNSTTAFGKPMAQPVFGTPTAPSGIFGQPSVLGQKVNPFSTISVSNQHSSTPTNVYSTAINSNNNNVANLSSNPFEQAKTKATSNASSKSELFGQQNPFATAKSNLVFGAPSFISGTGKPPMNLSTHTKSPFSAATENPFSILSNKLGDDKPPASTSSSPFSNAGGNFSFQSNIHNTPPNKADSVQAQPFGKAINQTVHDFKVNPNPTALSGVTRFSSENKTVDSQSNDASQKTLKTFRGRAVKYNGVLPGYINEDGIWERIWFPDGKLDFSRDALVSNDTEYDEATEKAFAYAKKNKKFKDGLIPTLPPKEEFCGFDF